MIRVGVIGVGFWGANHVRVLNELEEAELVFVVDKNEERAKTIAKRYKVTWFCDYLEALKEGVEAVTICTPTSTHFEIARSIIKSGIHILLEKPFTGSLAHAKTLIDMARKEGVKVIPGFIERFNPAVEKLKKLIKEGRVGEIIAITAERVSRRPIRIMDVGVLKDLGIHDIDVIRFITGSEFTSVYCILGSISGEHEDHAMLMMKLDNGSIGLMNFNWLTPRKVRKLKVIGTEGIITIDYITQEVIIENNDAIMRPIMSYVEPLKRELKHFIRVVENSEAPIVNGIDAVRALEVIEAAHKSSKIGQPVKLSCLEK